jgi:phenylalanyl-tRNA synthetase alpha chain
MTHDISGAGDHPRGQDLARDIERLEDDGRDRIAAATTLEALRALETAVLGKRSALAELRQRLGALDPDDRRTAGKVLNAALQALAAAVADRRAVLESADRAGQVEAERLDLSEVLPGRPAGHLHLITQAIQELEDVFVGMGFTVAEGPEVETEWHNFGALNFPPPPPPPPQ